MASAADILEQQFGSTPYTERDIDKLTRTLLGEAGGEGPDGMAAVAHVILNRHNNGGYGNSIYDVVTRGKNGYHQFSAWNSIDKGGNNQVNLSSNSAAYKRARAIAEEVLNGSADPTGGALNYYSPSGMTGKNGTKVGEPDWARGRTPSAQIGNHLFFAPGGGSGGRSGRRTIDPATQDALRRAGFDPGASDGINGPRTTAAIKAFQQARGLVADGIVGPKTTAALQGMARPRTMRELPATFRPSFGNQVNRAFDATGGDMESPLSRLSTSTTGWDNGDFTWDGTDVRAPIKPVDYARARAEAANGIDDRLSSLTRPQVASPPPLFPRPRPIMPPTAPTPMPGRPASLTPPPLRGPISTWGDMASAPVIRAPSIPTISGARPALTVGVQPAGTVQMPPGARPASVGPAPSLSPLLTNVPLPGMMGRNPMGGMYRPLPVAPQPLTPSLLLRRAAQAPRPLPGTTRAKVQPLPPAVVTALQRRQAQQDDWARRGLDQFGMLPS